MKIIGISSSPRKDSNSEFLVKEALITAKNAGAETKIYKIEDLNIKPCRACDTCGPEKDCVINDDAAEILDEIVSADALVFGTPIYFGQMSAQGKLITDRFYSIARNTSKSVEGKKIGLIFTHSAPTGAVDQYIEVTKAGLFGYLGFNIVDVIDVGEVSAENDISAHEDAIKKAQSLGNKL